MPADSSDVSTFSLGIAWNAHGQLEVLVNGRLQGSSAKSKRGKV